MSHRQNRQTMLALQETDLRHVEDATVNRYAFVDIQYPQYCDGKNS